MRLERLQKIETLVKGFDNLDYIALETDNKELLDVLRPLEAAVDRVKELHDAFDRVINQEER